MGQCGLDEGKRDLVMLSPLPIFVPSQEIRVVGLGINTLSDIGILQCQPINNKTYDPQNYLREQNMDLACITETWVKEGEMVTLNHLTLPCF